MAIAKANQALDPSDNGDAMTAGELQRDADKLQRAADELQKTIESVVSAGLSKSHPVVIEATKLGKSLRDKGIKMKVSATHVV